MTAAPKILLPLPGDVDLSDLPFMPLHDRRLMSSRSWLLAKNWRGGGPGLGFCLFNLWTEAFRTVPAGSLEDDDDLLADKARCDIDFWLVIKDKALRGWERHGGRVWHPVVCEVAWDVWVQRLASRYLKALDSNRAAGKRALDKGHVPPDPIGSQEDWIALKFPATSAYQETIRAAVPAPVPKESPSDKSENPLDNDPKRSEGKDIPPVIPQSTVGDRPEEAGRQRTASERKAWYAGELHRLQNEFRPMLPVMLMQLQQPGVRGEFGLVKNFKGCWVQRGGTGKPEIVARSKKRADAITQQHGDWLKHYFPDLSVRHAKVDELRARPAA